MKEKIAYFFGAGTEVEFSLFTPAHILPVVWMIAMILLIRKNKDTLRQWKHEESIRYI